MTLAELVARWRPREIDPVGEWGISEVLTEVEADPDFTLRDRVETLTKEWENNPPDWHIAGARRLRELLEGKQ